MSTNAWKWAGAGAYVASCAAAGWFGAKFLTKKRGPVFLFYKNPQGRYTGKVWGDTEGEDATYFVSVHGKTGQADFLLETSKDFKGHTADLKTTLTNDEDPTKLLKIDLKIDSKPVEKP